MLEDAALLAAIYNHEIQEWIAAFAPLVRYHLHAQLDGAWKELANVEPRLA